MKSFLFLLFFFFFDNLKTKSDFTEIIKKIEEERISRNLHSYSKNLDFEDIDLYEQFVVVGIDDNKKKKPEILFTYPNGEDGGKKKKNCKKKN